MAILRRRIFIETADLSECKLYLTSYIEKGWKIVQRGVGDNFWFEVEKYE